jgi:hypothetical protein
MTDVELHYLRCIWRRLLQLKKEVEDYSLAADALADEIDWLDCFIDRHERQ